MDFRYIKYNITMTKIIFITGGSASGKSTVATQISEALKGDATIVTQDSFYLPKGTPETNYDEPSAFDWKLQEEALESLSKGLSFDIPIYNFSKHARDGFETIEPKKVIIFEGLFTFHDKKVSKHADFQIFVDTPSDIRLARRLRRDISQRGRDMDEVLNRWEKDVEPSYKKFINSLKKDADIIIPWTKVKQKAVKAVIATINSLEK